MEAIGGEGLSKSLEISYFRKIVRDHAKNSFDELKNNQVYIYLSDDPDLKKINGITRFCSEFMIQNLMIKIWHQKDCVITAH